MAAGVDALGLGRRLSQRMYGGIKDAHVIKEEHNKTRSTCVIISSNSLPSPLA
jgi:hypothetical protein